MEHHIEIEDINQVPVIHLSKNNGDSNFGMNDINLNSHPRKLQSVNFGSGVELLMNDKRKPSDGKKPGGSTPDIELGDLNDLEAELNKLTGTTSAVEKELDIKAKSKSKSMLFKDALNAQGSDTIKVNTREASETGSAGTDFTPGTIPLGKATAQFAGNLKTDDGFKKFSNIPIDPDKTMSATPKLSQEDTLKEKFSILRKLEALESKGVKLTKRYSMESNFQEMKGEYEMIMSEKERSNSVKFQGKMLMAAITGVEFLNNRFDPFDIKLDGWSEQLNENIDDYDEIFGELHEKYKSKAKMAPEIKLIFQMAGSAIMVHMTNTMFKSSMPGMDDIMRQNPELMQQFTQAAVSSMGEQNPGFGGFMNNIIGNSKQSSRNEIPQNKIYEAPPHPMKTRTDKSTRPQVHDNRPDLAAARGDSGVDITDNFELVGVQPQARSSRADAPQRPEMKGPTDIDDILSGLKTKTVSVPTTKTTIPMKDSSTISIQDIKDLQNAKVPSRSNRRKKSEKTSISLDI